MTNERTQAYGRVVQTLDELGAYQAPARRAGSHPRRRRHPHLRLDLDEAREALQDMGDLADHLLASGRWLEERIDMLVANLLACGPTSRRRQSRRPPP